MTDEKLNKLVSKMRGLLPYKNKTDEELKAIVLAKELEKDGIYKNDEEEMEAMFSDKAEQKEAVRLIRKYLNNYSLETPSDKNTVKQLVFLEVFNNRLQRELNNYYASQQPAPPKTVESLHSNLNQISSLKDKLGLSKDKQKTNNNEGYVIMDTLFKKWKMWREENQGSRSLSCPHCGKMILLKIRTDIWESQKHPFFKDKILANTHLMEMYKTGKISKHDVAKVLGTSIDYVAWLVKKVYQREFNIEERKRWEAEQETVTAKTVVQEEESSKAVDEEMNVLPTVNSDESQ